jgi:hypothetical protein
MRAVRCWLSQLSYQYRLYSDHGGDRQTWNAQSASLAGKASVSLFDGNSSREIRAMAGTEKGTGDIMPEMRKGQKDRALQRAYNSVRIWGTSFVDAARIVAAIPSGKLKFRSKEDNITGLQICDLLAHPSHVYVRSHQHHQVTLAPFAAQVVPILVETKYDRSPWNKDKIVGYGIKYLP